MAEWEGGRLQRHFDTQYREWQVTERGTGRWKGVCGRYRGGEEAGVFSVRQDLQGDSVAGGFNTQCDDTHKSI